MDPEGRAQVRLQRLLFQIDPNLRETARASEVGGGRDGAAEVESVPTGASSSGETLNDSLKWNGWGYADSQFALSDDGRRIYFTGKRYKDSGMILPHLADWIEEKTAISVATTVEAQPYGDFVCPPLVNTSQAFLDAIDGHCAGVSQDDLDRIHHAHGHTCQEVYALRHGSIERAPDAVVWPRSHEDVEVIVAAAAEHGVVIIPYGGGTSVTNALECPADEERMIVSLDMQRMNKVVWVDHENLTACVQAGIAGKDLEAALAAEGVTMGHEPDSFEFSTLGGWVSTRASGMRKNVYGNIEDIIVGLRLVTPTGTVEKKCQVPRMSCGPDVFHMVMGHEGILGVVTDAVIKVRPQPTVLDYGAILFHDFSSGVAFMREVALRRAAPASVRLVDNMQFQLGQALQPEKPMLSTLIGKFKKWYVTQWKGFDVDAMCAATLKFEGESKEDVANQAELIYGIAAKHGGFKADAESGKRGYNLTFLIAYIRDLAFNHGMISESFETSIPWTNVEEMCERVKARVAVDCAREGIVGDPFISCRVTQTYDAGACVYFYLGFVYLGMADPVGSFSRVEHGAREEILACGGSISHHHGVGKHRLAFMRDTLSDAGLEMLYAVKDRIDPDNVFGSRNLLPARGGSVGGGH